MPLRTQKLFALAAIVLLALNLRTAVGSLSPVVNYIQQDIALPIVTIGPLWVRALRRAAAKYVHSRVAGDDAASC